MARAPVNHILVLVDGTESSFRAADKAIALARALGAKMTALAVVDTETLRQLLNVKILADTEMGEFEKELEQSAQRQLEDVRERAMDQKVTVELVHAAGNTEMVVPKEVESRRVDLIAMGAFESKKAMHDLLARQRQQILDRSGCPVLVVR